MPSNEGMPRVARRHFIAGGLAVAAGVAAAAAGIGSVKGRPTPEPLRDEAPPQWNTLLRTDGVAPIHASLLPSGTVLMAGVAPDGITYPSFVIEPTITGPIRVHPLHVPMRHPGDSLFCAGHAHLADGSVLHVGGGNYFESGLTYGLVYRDDAPHPWLPIDEQVFGGPAWYPTVTRVADGSMVVVSGFVDFGLNENRTIQSFDPASFAAGDRPWELLVPAELAPDISATGSDYTHTFLLPEPIELEGHPRQVAMIGKSGRVHLFDHRDAFDDPASRFAARPNSFRPEPAGLDPAVGASSVLLSDGRILIAGGGEENGSRAVSQAHIYDPLGDTWRTIETGIARSHPATVLLPDATVLLVNGNGGSEDPRKPQIIDPISEAVYTGPPWPDPRLRGYHNVALLLPDASVLIAGGQSDGEDSERADLRYYFPPYMAGVAPEERPRIRAAPRVVSYRRPFVIEVEGGPIHKVTLLALGSMTHSFDSNQRCVELFDGELLEPTLSIEGPQGPSTAPPGDYMLFVLRRDAWDEGNRLVPSVARVIRVS